MFRYPTKKSSPGFTIVELIIVIVVIAILATISILAYNGIQKNAGEAVLKSDLTQAANQLELNKASTDVYPADTSALKKSTGTTYQYTYTSATNSYCLTASNQWGDFYISDTTGTPQSGVCSGHTSQVNTGGWTAVATGTYHSCGIKNSKAYCWGNGYWGELGNGGTTSSNTPVAVSTSVMSGTVTAIAVGDFHTCAIASARAYCWGRNTNYELGDSSSISRSTPDIVSTSLMSGDVTSLSSGSKHTCAISQGKAYCWGYNGYGELGNGTNSNSNVPVAVSTSVMSGTVTAIASTYGSTCAISSGQAYCWGYNGYGELGNGTNSDSNVPVAVSTSVMSGTVTAIAPPCALVAGKAYCWGNGYYGQLGNGTNSDSNVPVAVSTSVMSGTVTAIAPSCALVAGKAYCWGNGYYGQLGNGTNSNSNVPVAVSTSVMSGTVTAISHHDNHTCAISFGQAYCWGNGDPGQLGNGGTSNSNTPVLVSPTP